MTLALEFHKVSYVQDETFLVDDEFVSEPQLKHLQSKENIRFKTIENFKTLEIFIVETSESDILFNGGHTFKTSDGIKEMIGFIDLSTNRAVCYYVNSSKETQTVQSKTFVRDEYFSSVLLRACAEVSCVFNPVKDCYEEHIILEFLTQNEEFFILKNGIKISKDLKVIETSPYLWRVESSSYEVKQNGTFNCETAYFLNKPIFFWSDNNGFNSTISEDEASFLPKQIKELYDSFQERDEKFRSYVDENWEDDGFNDFTAQGF